MDILRRLENIDKEPLLEFFEEKQFCSNLERNLCNTLKERLEDFIRNRVVIKDEKNLGYLKELLQFDAPLEIYSTNYDTCVEQLSYISRRRYTDGFNIDWNEKNFCGDFDVKHYKLHGSVIWFENVKTKQCIKIPAQAFYEGKQVKLKLIYGEDVEPLLIYPAQKAEYVEPLTDLQLMFKKRLFDKETRFVVFVGYSFRDSYVICMLWDAARINENLHVVLILPHAQETYENKLKYINKEQKFPSGICDKTVCLPYPFGTIISRLKNHYLSALREILEKEKDLEQAERRGENTEWQNVFQKCVETEFLSKAEYILEEKMRKNWDKLNFDGSNYKILFSFKGLLHSVIAKDGYTDRWLKRFNDSLEFLKTENLRIHSAEQNFYVFFEHQESKYLIGQIISIVESLLTEKANKLQMLSPRFENSLNIISKSLSKLGELKNYLDTMRNRISWQDYLTLRSDAPEAEKIKELSHNLPSHQPQNFPKMQTPEKFLDSLILTVERRTLEKIFGGKTFQVELDYAKK